MVVPLLLTSCNKDENLPDPVPPTEKLNLIIDSDMGVCIDDLVAMQVLFHYQETKPFNLLAVMSSRKSAASNRFFDCMMHYYKADDVPLGLIEGEEAYFEITPYYQLADSILPDGKPLFAPTGIPLSQRLPAWKQYRKTLSEAADNSVTIVCIGMFTNLGLLLDSPADEYSPLTGDELVKKKVKMLSVMAGTLGKIKLAGKPGFVKVEYNVAGDILLAQKVVANWPGKICIFPMEEGMKYPSDHQAMLEASSAYPNGPIHQLYVNYDEWKGGDVGSYLWDAITIIHTIEGEDKFSCSAPGIFKIDDAGKTVFAPDSLGNAHIIQTQTIDYQWVNRIILSAAAAER